jgi:hypothetical protein
MELKRRFMFHGDAVALGGRLVRPKDIVLDPKCASALPVTGGRTSSKIKGASFGKFISFGSAFTSAEGFLDDTKKAVAVSRGLAERESASTSTAVRAEITKLVVGDTVKLTVKRMVGALSARSAPVGQETSVKVHSDSSIEGVAVGGHGLIIELSPSLFQRCDTCAKLLAETAAPSPSFAKAHARQLFAPAAPGGADAAGGHDHGDGVPMHGTIVKSIRWAGTPYPGATIDGHVVTVPDFGTIYFGEVAVQKMSRRLTMMRLDLGSPVGGDAAFADVQDNGTWS